MFIDQLERISTRLSAGGVKLITTDTAEALLTIYIPLGKHYDNEVPLYNPHQTIHSWFYEDGN